MLWEPLFNSVFCFTFSFSLYGRNSALVVTLRVWDEGQYLMNTSFLFNSGLIQGFTVRILVSKQLKSIDVLNINWWDSKRAYSEGKYACTVYRSDLI